MASPVIPRDKKYIRGCSQRAWMRLTMLGQPITGMVVGNINDESLLYVDQKGLLHERSLSALNGEVVFIDYLLADESVTIFGEAETREDGDDTIPEFVPPRPDLEFGVHMSRVPNFIPFRMRSGGCMEYDVVIVPTKIQGGRVGLCFTVSQGRRSRDEVWSPLGTNEVFMCYLDEPNDDWKKHRHIKEYHGQDPATWPTV